MKKKSTHKSFKFAEGTVYSRAQSQYWQVYAPLLTGKALRISTGVRIEDDPNGEQARLFLANLRQSRSLLVKSPRKEQAYRTALKLIAQDCDYTPKRLTIKEAISNYLQTVTAKNSTKQNYISALSKFEKHFGKHTFIDMISTKMLEEFQTKLSDLYSIASSRSTMRIIRILWNYLRKFEDIDTNPFSKISLLKNDEKKEKRIFKKEEIDLLVRETKETYWNPAIMLGIYTGQRLMDIFNLKWEQIDLQKNIIKFQIQKTKKDLTVYIHSKLKEYLLSIPNKEGKVCDTNKSQESLSIEFHRLLIKLNIVEQPPKGKGKRRIKSELTFHSLRRTLTSWLASAGISPEIRSKIIGNSPQINLKHYTEIQNEAVINAVNSLKI